MGSPVLPQFSLCTCRRHYPGGTAGCLSLSSPAMPAFPVERQVSFHIARFEACSTFTRVTARTLAESLNDPLHRRLQPGRYLPDCSDCYRPERPLPEGTCTLSRTVPFHGTRFLRALLGDHAWLPPSPARRRKRLHDLSACVGAPEPHDFAVRDHAARLARSRSLTDLVDPPCNHVARTTRSRPPHPIPTSVTIAIRPS